MQLLETARFINRQADARRRRELTVELSTGVGAGAVGGAITRPADVLPRHVAAAKVT
jgi:putative N-acetylmannosamine-6-phosphate epimerase